MKASKEPGAFRPITLVLESQLEVDFLWALLNANVGAQRRMLEDTDAAPDGMDLDAALKLSSPLWDELDRVR